MVLCPFWRRVRYIGGLGSRGRVARGRVSRGRVSEGVGYGVGGRVSGVGGRVSGVGGRVSGVEYLGFKVSGV